LKAEAVAPEQGVSVLGAGSVCGVDALRFRPDRTVRTAMRNALTVSEDACVLLFVGRLAREKGIYDLLQAFSRLAAIHAQAVLWLVGPDEEGLSLRLKGLVAECADRVRWIGATFEPEHFMASADVLVLPSYREGFGLVIIEAASCGIPAIAYRIDGVVDAIAEGESGMLVDKASVEKLFHAMQSMLSAPNMRAQLGVKARERAHREFSSDAITAAWLMFYENELDERRH
jgi:glycosyltransferase involved in cell wall biosynthesis